MKLLDTDILTLFFAGNAAVVERVRHETETIATSVITRIEVLRGRFEAILKADDGTQLERAQQKLLATERDLTAFAIIPIDGAIAARFDKLRKQKKLKKIGRADLLIASIALAHGATLVTRNVRHFKQVPGVAVENWAD